MKNNFANKIASFYPVDEEDDRPTYNFLYKTLPTVYGFSFSVALVAITPKTDYTLKLEIIDEENKTLLSKPLKIKLTKNVPNENMLSTGVLTATFTINTASIPVPNKECMFMAFATLLDDSNNELDKSHTWFVTMPNKK